MAWNSQRKSKIIRILWIAPEGIRCQWKVNSPPAWIDTNGLPKSTNFVQLISEIAQLLAEQFESVLKLFCLWCAAICALYAISFIHRFTISARPLFSHCWSWSGSGSWSRLGTLTACVFWFRSFQNTINSL